MTEQQLAEIEKRANAAFKAPWKYTRFEIDCGYDNCDVPACVNDPDKHEGFPHEVIEVEAPDEYPDGQCVAQIYVPGLETFAERNGEFIAHARQDVPALIAAVRELQRWKSEAMAVQEEWYKLPDALGEHFKAKLGDSIAEKCVEAVTGLVATVRERDAEIASLKLALGMATRLLEDRTKTKADALGEVKP